MDRMQISQYPAKLGRRNSWARLCDVVPEGHREATCDQGSVRALDRDRRRRELLVSEPRSDVNLFCRSIHRTADPDNLVLARQVVDCVLTISETLCVRGITRD